MGKQKFKTDYILIRSKKNVVPIIAAAAVVALGLGAGLWWFIAH